MVMCENKEYLNESVSTRYARRCPAVSRLGQQPARLEMNYSCLFSVRVQCLREQLDHRNVTFTELLNVKVISPLLQSR